MSCIDELFIGDTGTSIEFLIKECDDSDPDNPVEVLVDVHNATDMSITFVKEDGTDLVVTNPDVGFLTDGTDGIIRYLTLSDTLDVVGTWKAQLRVTMPGGVWYTSIIKFKVKAYLSK